MFWCGVSLAGICLYLRPGFSWPVGCWQVTLSTQFAPTVAGSIASRPLPSSRCGNSSDAGCDSMSYDTAGLEQLRARGTRVLDAIDESSQLSLCRLCWPWMACLSVGIRCSTRQDDLCFILILLDVLVC
uniref:Putative secreted protein n=2 Tax=Nyssorhynchus TaxID=44543 RepID=A0A2M4DDC6_ANODA